MKNNQPDWIARTVAAVALIVSVLALIYAYETYQAVDEIRDILVSTAKSDVVQTGKALFDGLFGGDKP